jgi:single-stranded-DNA-specific exonuclease
MVTTTWQMPELIQPPTWLQEKVGDFAALLLCQRGIVEPDRVEAFLSAAAYHPTAAGALPEMRQAIARIKVALQERQTIAIWGDFDADGITATAVLWEGLGQFFARGDRLFFYIPDRLKESHGISVKGIDQLRSQLQEMDRNLDLIISCDNGSTSLEAIDYANGLGIDVIVTDHHTLPELRPPVTAIVNPRYLPEDHPLFHLSGVAVAYKLMEALYDEFPEQDRDSLEKLLDLVAIGLVADLVNLKDDCRYLAQRGIERLRQKQRLGVKLLLEQCKKAGDRPIDISFGIAPRLNAVSRIWGDVRKCVELLTTDDPHLAKQLVVQTEIANTERKALQRLVFKQVQAKIAQLDLSTTGIILLVDAQWSVGVLGLVAGQVVAEYGRPTILCTLEDGIVRGSARSLLGINLYELLKGQEHLLLGFGGHPLAGGLSFTFENLRLLTEALDQRFWSQYGQLQTRTIAVDLEVTIPELNGELFKQFRQLEPFGMGNPSPKLLLRNCRFIRKSHKKIRGSKGQKIEYLKTDFTLGDRQGNQITGDWWGHYAFELPDTEGDRECDVIVELIYNAHDDFYHVRLMDVHDSAESNVYTLTTPKPQAVNAIASSKSCLDTTSDKANQTWRTLLGIAKYLSRTGESVSRSRLAAKLGIDHPRVLAIGLEELPRYGYAVQLDDHGDRISIRAVSLAPHKSWQSSPFIQSVNEWLFQHQFSNTA